MTTNSTVRCIPKGEFDSYEKVHIDKIKRLVADISQLSLLEASQLNELLKVNNKYTFCMSVYVCSFIE